MAKVYNKGDEEQSSNPKIIYMMKIKPGSNEHPSGNSTQVNLGGFGKLPEPFLGTTSIGSALSKTLSSMSGYLMFLLFLTFLQKSVLRKVKYSSSMFIVSQGLQVSSS